MSSQDLLAAVEGEIKEQSKENDGAENKDGGPAKQGEPDKNDEGEEKKEGEAKEGGEPGEPVKFDGEPLGPENSAVVAVIFGGAVFAAAADHIKAEGLQIAKELAEEMVDTVCSAIRDDPPEIEEFFTNERHAREDGAKQCLAALKLFGTWAPGQDPVAVEERGERQSIAAEFLIERQIAALSERPPFTENEMTACFTSLVALASASVMDLVTWKAEKTVAKKEQENIRKQLEEDQRKIEVAKKELEAFQQNTTAAVREVEEEVKQRLSESWQQIDQQRRMVAEEAKRLEVERERMEKEKEFRLEVLSHENECRRMEEQAWSTLWEERRRHEKESDALHKEVNAYRAEHDRLSAEAAEGRSSILFKQQEMRRRHLDAEIQRLESEVAKMNVKNKVEAQDVGLELSRDNEEAGTQENTASPNRICSMADHLVELETQGVHLVMELERDRVQRELYSSTQTPAWIMQNTPIYSREREMRRHREDRYPDMYSPSPSWNKRTYSPRTSRTASPTPPHVSASKTLHILDELQSLRSQVATLSHRLNRRNHSPSARTRSPSTRYSPSCSPNRSRLNTEYAGKGIVTTGRSVTMPVALARSLAAASVGSSH